MINFKDDVDLLECLKTVKPLTTDRHFIIFDTAIYGGFCGHRFLMKGIIDGEMVDEICEIVKKAYNL